MLDSGFSVALCAWSSPGERPRSRSRARRRSQAEQRQDGAALGAGAHYAGRRRRTPWSTKPAAPKRRLRLPGALHAASIRMIVPPPAPALRPPCRRGPRRPGARSPARGPSRACRAPRSRGRSGRRRAAGPRRRCRARGRARSLTVAERTSTSPSGGLHFAALSSRFATARSIVAGTPPTIASSSAPERDVRAGFVASARSLPRRRGRAGLPPAAPAPARRGRARSARRPAPSSRSAGRRRRRAAARVRRAAAPVARQHLDVRAQAGERRSQLVRGVLDELALARADSSSAASIVLKLVASRLSSSVPAASIRSTGRGSRRPARPPGQPAPGAIACATTRPRPAARRSRRGRSEISQRRIRESAWSTSSSGRATWRA